MDRQKEHALVNETLSNRSSRLRFPEPLETQYRERNLRHIIRNFNGNVKYVVLVYLLAGLSIFGLFMDVDKGNWPFAYLMLGVFIGLATIFTRFHRLHRYYQYYISAISAASLTFASIAPVYLTEQEMVYTASMAAAYAVIVVYTMTGMYFLTAVLSNLLTFSLVVAYVFSLDIAFDWSTFHQTFTVANCIGAGLCYSSERRTRRLYLKSELVRNEKARSDSLAKEMEIISNHDPLTGLANRRYFDKMFEQEWRRAKRHHSPIALMLVDVDYFKFFNDYYGHQLGDECLIKIADILKMQTQRVGDLAARYGGEEFILLFPNTNNIQVREIAEKALRDIRAAGIRHEKSEISNHVTASFGIASFADAGQVSIRHMIRVADTALYEAKHNGRDRWQIAKTDNQDLAQQG